LVAFASPPAVCVDTPPVTEHDDHGVYQPPAQGTTAQACESGISSGYACRNVELLSRVRLEEMGGGGGSDSWGWKDPDTGRYYALMGRSNGSSFLDVTDPENPVYLGNLPSTRGQKPWRDMKTYANHVFVVADGIIRHGMQVFDLTRLRGVDSPQTFEPDFLYNEIEWAHNIAINEDSGFAYVVGSDECRGGLHMIDIRQPDSPAFAGCFSADGYTHDVQCVNYHGPDPDHQGAEICLASNEDSLTVVDVSDKSNPRMLGKADYPMVGYSHQGWLTEDHRVFFLGDELDEQTFGTNTRTLAFDVSDLDDPHFSNAHLHGTSVIDHNLYVNGAYIYQANYLAGLRILRIDHAASAELAEVAYFDTSPLEDSRDFGGAWNVYPFFDNGTILVSDFDGGLFILRAALPEAAAQNAPINGRLSGLWVADGLNDQGLTLIVGENAQGPFVFFAWFIYLAGEPFWVAGDVAFEYGDDEVDIPAQRLQGLEFITPGEDMAGREDIGTLTLHAHGCRELHLMYEFEGLGSGELDMHPLASVQGRECPE
jgi:choice-of-anchor B domain-containing protein